MTRTKPATKATPTKQKDVMSATVAALFVDPKGPYWLDPRCDCWDEVRDARDYRGPFPVVAHPPCKRWISFAALNYARYGGEHNRPGNDGGCFESALLAVRLYGGVLEHPSGSRAFVKFGLPKPFGVGWNDLGHGEWICEVWQSAYGHKARKRTWLYYVGTNRPAELNWERRQGTHQIGWFDRAKPTLGKKQVHLTPPEFADALVSLAVNCAGSP